MSLRCKQKLSIQSVRQLCTLSIRDAFFAGFAEWAVRGADAVVFFCVVGLRVAVLRTDDVVVLM